MAGNDAIRFLRGSGHESTQILNIGQPYFDKTNNDLYVGQGNQIAQTDVLFKPRWDSISTDIAKVNNRLDSLPGYIYLHKLELFFQTPRPPLGPIEEAYQLFDSVTCYFISERSSRYASYSDLEKTPGIYPIRNFELKSNTKENTMLPLAVQVLKNGGVYIIYCSTSGYPQGGGTISFDSTGSIEMGSVEGISSSVYRVAVIPRDFLG